MMKKIYDFRNLLLLISAFWYAQNSSAQTTTTYTTPGSTTFTAPAGVTSVTIEAWGGGGRGGTRSTNGNGGGGGGGGYSKHTMSVTPGNNYTVVVGAGSSSTSNGGDSYFVSTATMVARGGITVADNANSGGNGGGISTANSGNVSTRLGGTGSSGSGTYGGGGGSSAGTASNGTSPSNTATGGTAPTGGGNGGNGRSATQGVGTAGTTPGGGGGGAYRTSSGTYAGGSGANGKVILTYGIAEIGVFSAYGANVADGSSTPSASEGTLFGSVNTGSYLTSEFIIVNTGNVALTLTAPVFSGTNGTEFTVLTSPGTSIAAGSTATMVIKFLPLGTGTRTGTITFTTNDADETTYNFNLSGTGTAPTMLVTGGSAPTTITNGAAATTGMGSAYGNQMTAFGSVSRSFTIQNTGTGVLNITSLAVTGSSDFTVVSSPASTLAVGGSTTFVIKFDPSASAARTGTVTILNSSSVGSFTFALSGTGIATPGIAGPGEVYIYNAANTDIPMYAPASTTYDTDFGSVNTYVNTSVTKTYTIRNEGTGLLTLTGASVAVTSGIGFSVTSTIVLSTIGSSSTATFTVTYNPTTAGTVTGVVTVNSSDANEGTYTFYITGTGTDPEIDIYGGNPLASMTDNTAASATYGTNFGTQNSTTGYVTKTFTLNNTGTGPLVISSVTNSNTTDYTVSTIASPIAAGESTTFTITFDPASNGTKTGIITINNNDVSESVFEINLTGLAVATAAGEITVKGGSPLTEIMMNEPANTAEGTDFGGTYVASGTIAKTFTITNTGASALSVSTPVLSGTAAADFSITANPASSVAATSGTTTFTITFNPSVAGTRSAMVSITNGDPNESPFTFYIQGTGNTYADSDGDNVTDDADVDDDNDGILDTIEQAACATLTTSTTSNKVFLNETFGTGTTATDINDNDPNATIDAAYDYNFNLYDGQYIVHNTAQVTAWADDDWYRGLDHTSGDTNGKMALINAEYTAGKFYSNTVSGVTPNVEVTFSFYAINLDRSDAVDDIDNRIRPNIRVEIRKVTDNTLITSLSTGNIAPSPTGTATESDWINYSLPFTTSETDFKVTFINNAPGGLGNDIAFDDITVSQKYCDMDHDDEADSFDLDDDNDGIPDAVEAGFKAYTNNKSKIDHTDNTKWVDANKNGLNDNIDPDYISNYYTAYIPDSDGDGIYDFMDYDSDNDTKFDIDEAQADTFYLSNTGGSYNGDGDIDGDGKGDNADTDLDGILDLNDDSTSYGTTAKAFPTDTDGDGTPDYLDVTSNGSTKDIAGTLYSSMDANNDGKIDGTADVDKDGIMDLFDSYNAVSSGSVVSVGSPRNLINKSLLIDFDGRNDYAESSQLLSGLSKATIMGWVKLDTNYPTTSTIVLGQDNFYITISGNTGSTPRRVTAIAGSYSATWTTSLDLSRWYHVAAVYDSGAGIKLYVNGSLKQTTSVSGNLASTSLKFTIGRKCNVSSNYFRGYIDEVRAFNTALTDDQLQKMVYQKISQNSTGIQGAIVPKDIESASWANLLAYYRMDDYKGNVADDYTLAGTDNGTSSAYCKIYNVKYIKTENTPLPFKTKQAGILDSTALTDSSNFIYGPDVTDNSYSVIQVQHDVTLANNLTGVGLIVDSGKKITVNNNNKIENSWYLDLQGTIDLVDKSQLVQGSSSTLASTTTGKIERDQQGTKIKYNYNYWSSPVSTSTSSTVNNGYTVAGVMKDGNSGSPVDMLWTSADDATGGSPVTLSGNWIYKYQNLTNAYASWSFVGENGSLAAGQGYTLKGSNTGSSTQNYVFVGKPNNGTITSAISASNLNLSGNPYPSAISASEFIKDNLPASSPSANAGTSGALTGSLYFWQHSATNTSHVYASYIGGYGVYSLVGGVAPVTAASGTSGQVGSSNTIPGDYIPVGQGFFVQGSTAGGNITFKNSQRAFVKENASNSTSLMRNSNATQSEEENNQDTPLASTIQEFIKIRVGFNNNVNSHRQVLIGFMNQNATDAFDLGYDALNFDTNPSDMYFKTPDSNLLVQGVGSFADTNIYPLGVTADTASPVSFTLDGVENLDENQPIYIFDAIDNSYHNIRDGIFETTLDEGTFEQRFSLRFSNPLGVTNPVAEDTINVAYTNNDQMLVIKNTLTSTTVESAMLFNVLGQQVSAWGVENQNQENIQIPVKNISAGTYIVKVKTTTGSVSKKIIIR